MYEKETAIIGLTILGSVALLKGIDSTLLTFIAGLIGALAGYTIGKVTSK